MKISIGTNIKDGPWGGGNLFAINLKNYLIENNHQVINNLKDDNIDLILLTEPRITSESSAFTDFDVFKYLTKINNQTLVVHRINECDERKNTKNVNKTLLEANKVADATIFVSTWLMKLFLSIGINDKNASVIYAGADENIFNSKGRVEYSNKNKLKIITHHWGNNWNKGFDIYSKLDDLIGTSEWSEKIEFSYIGNLPKNFNFKNSNYIPPLDGLELASELKKHHLYITASLNEPSGNHHIEAAQCGLPILYLNSGGIPEYCDGYGVSFTDDFEEKLSLIISEYETHKIKMKDYPFNSEKMCEDFLDLFNDLVNNKSSNQFIKLNWVSYLFLMKNKLLKFVRRDIFINLKNIIKKRVRK